MEREANAHLFGPDSPSRVVVPYDMNAGGQTKGLKSGTPVTPRVFVRQVLTEALHELGGVAWVVAFARANDGNARVFFQGITKLLPVELTGPGGSPLTIVIKKEGQPDISGEFKDGSFRGRTYEHDTKEAA